LAGDSDALADLRLEIELAAHSGATALISGEKGVGKTSVAHAIHAASPRRAQPLRIVDCGRADESSFDTDLFAGRASGPGGASGGAVAVLLTRVEQLPPALQECLIRALDKAVVAEASGAIRTRILASAGADLYARVQNGQFRSDLFYRLNILHLRVPPLRERREDIPALFTRCLHHAAVQGTTVAPWVAPDALEVLVSYAWPGNLRELRMVAEELVELRRNTSIDGRAVARRLAPAPVGSA
jgi:DNA-binding NtrC family response regulator